MEKYKPKNLKIVDTFYKIVDGKFINVGGGFRIVDVDSEQYQLSTILEFNPINSDFPSEMIREFAEELIRCYADNN